MRPRKSPLTLYVLLGVVIAALAFGLVAALTWGGEEEQAPPVKTVTVVPVVGGGPVTLDGDAEQTSSSRPEGVASHDDAKDETPPGISPEEAAEVLEPVAGIGEPQPLGGAQNLSCPFRPVQNHSSRAGAKVASVVYHYTVSDPGSLRAIGNLFNTPSFQASSHIGLEPDGECEQWVAYDRKAWTQGAFNPVSVSVEIICCRSDPTRAWWLAQPIIKGGLLAEWTNDRLRQFGLPARRVNPTGCTAQAGYTDHAALECGNTHTDVGRNFPWDVVSRQVSALHNSGSLTKLVWQARSGGAVLFQQQGIAVNGVGGYDRLLGVMRGRGEAAVKRAEKANGDVRIVLVEVLA